MRYRQLSPVNDMTFGMSQLNFLVDSPASVAQAIQTSLRLWLGEWYLNNSDGTPYPEGVIGYHSQATADATIQAQILAVTVIVSSTNVPSGAVPGQSIAAVTTIENYVSVVDPSSRAYSASCVVNTIYGPTPLQINDYNNF